MSNNNFVVAGKVSILGSELTILVGRYPQGGQLYVGLQESDGEPYGDFSTNLKSYGAVVESNEFCVKGWSENEHMVEPMLTSGFFEDTGRRIPSGFVQAPVWRLKGQAFERMTETDVGSR